MPNIPTTGLILTGGGARAAYQVGVLDAVATIRRHSDAPAGWTPPKDQGKTMTDAKWDDLVAQEGKLAAHRSACRAARGKGVQ